MEGCPNIPIERDYDILLLLGGPGRYPKDVVERIVPKTIRFNYSPVILSLHIIIEIFEPTVNN